MGAVRTFQLIPPTRAADGAPQSGPQRWRKSFTPRVERASNVTDAAKSLPAREEWEVVQRAMACDSQALATLFARERRKLYRIALSALPNREDAEDALQNGLLSAFVSLRSFEGRSSFSTWLTRIVLNAAPGKRRRLRVLPRTTLHEVAINNPEPWAERLVDPHPSPEQVYALAEARDAVQKKMSHLPPLLRSAFRLRDVEHLSNREPANAARVKISAIKSRAARARRRLRSLLAAEGVTLSRTTFSRSVDPSSLGIADYIHVKRRNTDDRSGPEESRRIRTQLGA
jgi:RNA polymerase sigma-70 factor, ECF subfamily